MSEKEQLIEVSKKLKISLKKNNMTMRCFANDVYIHLVEKEASSLELDKHFERFKTAIKRNIEITSLYWYYYEMNFNAPTSVTKESTQAAWEFYVELTSRISTVEIKDSEGSDQAALDSLYALFGIWRELIKRHGKKSLYFFKFSNRFINNDLRSVTTKWHRHINDKNFDTNEFRIDLKDLQKSAKKLAFKIEKVFLSI